MGRSKPPARRSGNLTRSFGTLPLKPWDAGKNSQQNSIDLARLAALAGDTSDARAQLAAAEARFQAQL